MASQGQKPEKLCFVTIGATAAFDALIESVLSAAVLQTLSKAGFKKVLVQYGKDGRSLYESLSGPHADSKELGLQFEGFDFDSEGLYPYMVSARESGGVVISHAGSGSILDALRVNAPLIVVPNPKLLDNHQDDLAEALSKQGYVVHGKLQYVHVNPMACVSLNKSSDLAPAIGEAEILRKKHMGWPPVNSGMHRQAQGLQGVIDEELGFLD